MFALETGMAGMRKARRGQCVATGATLFAILTVPTVADLVREVMVKRPDPRRLDAELEPPGSTIRDPGLERFKQGHHR